jgi:hypothetical protein
MCSAFPIPIILGNLPFQRSMRARSFSKRRHSNNCGRSLPQTVRFGFAASTLNCLFSFATL